MERYISRYKQLLAAIMAVIGLASCEKIIDITIPDKERKIVVNGLINPDEVVRINLSRSLSVLESDSLVFISGADVKLFSGSNLIGKLQETTGGFYSLPGFKPQAGQTYRLTAAIKDMKPVEALAVLPSVVPISSVDTAMLTGDWGQKELQVSVMFKDPPGVRNFYGFGVDATYKEYDYNKMSYTGKKLTSQVYLSGNSDRFLKEESNNIQGKLYFQDLLFDGMTKTIEFSVSDFSYYQSDTVWLNIRMEQIEMSYFRYLLSFEAYGKANNNPFSEPVQVYTNVTDGFGIFAGSSFTSFTIVTSGAGKIK